MGPIEKITRTNFPTQRVTWVVKFFYQEIEAGNSSLDLHIMNPLSGLNQFL